jgi:nucleotide-binding universal stress UspA family protein
MTRKFLVVVDDTPEFDSALRYAARRAASTSGRVVLLRVISPASFEHWSGVRDEIERQQRDEAQALLNRVGERAAELSGSPGVFAIEVGETRDAIRKAIEADPDIKILVLAAASGGRGPGPLITMVTREGVGAGGRRLPVTIVPGDLSDSEIADLA